MEKVGGHWDRIRALAGAGVSIINDLRTNIYW